jgi:hypothetical protein
MKAAREEGERIRASGVQTDARLRTAGKELSEGDLDDDLQRNQFNFTERAVQCYTQPIKTRVVSTTPPEVRT